MKNKYFRNIFSSFSSVIYIIRDWNVLVLFTLDIEMAVPFESEKSKRGVVGIKCVLVMKGVMKGFWNYF